jgi:hypothetical protein
MEDWGLEREEWFWGFLELPNGIPEKDTFRRLFERIQLEELLKATLINGTFHRDSKTEMLPGTKVFTDGRNCPGFYP